MSRMKFFKTSDIKIKWWCGIFLFKVLVGILYGYIHSLSYSGADTFYSFKQGIRVYNTFPNFGFTTYFKLVFLPCHYPSYSGIERWTHNSIPYGDESYYLIIRFHALVALISGCYYNVHVVFYNILSFAGCVFLYRAFKDELKEKSILLLSALIFIPSVVFWTSGIHKDGLSLLGIGMLFYSLKQNEEFLFSKIFLVLISIILLYIVRSYILLILIPLIAVYLIFRNKKKNLLIYYSISFFVFFFIVLLVSSVVGGISPVDKIVWWKNAFASLTVSENSIPLPQLHPDAISFMQLIPHAFVHSFLQPFIWNAKNGYQIFIGLQDWLLFFSLIFLIIYSVIKRKVFPHLFYLSIGYTISVYILLGMIVPNLGALSRYKSSGTFFLALAVISLIPTGLIKKVFKH